MRKTITTVLLAALVALGVSVSRADDNKQKAVDPAKKADSKETPKTPADALTHETLKERLEAMGYDFKTIKSTNGTPMYLVQVDANNYRYVFYLSLSSDFKNLWVTCALRPLPEKGKVRADILEMILAKNYELGPIHFSLKTNRYLYLDLALGNTGLNARRLRTELDGFMSAIRTTEHLWNPDKYPAPVTVAQGKDDKDATKAGKDSK
jgi:hypothetical protein